MGVAKCVRLCPQTWGSLGLCLHPRGSDCALANLDCALVDWAHHQEAQCGSLCSVVGCTVRQIIGGQALQSASGCALVDLGCTLVAQAGCEGTNDNAEGPTTKKIITQYKGGGA